jgi:hypothetical protein
MPTVRGKNWTEADSLKLIDARKLAQEAKYGTISIIPPGPF